MFRSIIQWSLGASLLFVMGCESASNMRGTLTLRTGQVILTSGGSKVTVPAGSYTTYLQLSGQGATVYIKTQAGDVQFAVPVKSDAMFGAIRVSASEMKQSFDLNGMIREEETPFTREVTEKCEWSSEDKEECLRNRRTGEVTCEMVRKPIYGVQQVQEEGKDNTKIASIDLFSAKTGQKIGSFYATYDLGEEVTYRRELTGCRPF